MTFRFPRHLGFALAILTASLSLSSEGSGARSCLAQDQAAGKNVVVTAAEKVATAKKDKKYGDKPEEINCVGFLKLVLDEFKVELSDDQEETLSISNVAAADLAKLVDASDDKITGVQKALVDAGRGTKIDLKEAAAGDFVQYWYKKGDKWHGHASVVVGRTGDTFDLLGAHASKGKIDTLTRVSFADKKAFFVRLK